MKSALTYTLILATIAALLYAGWLQSFPFTSEADQIEATNRWMVCNALSIVLLSGIIGILAEGKLKMIAVAFTIVAFGDLMDEIYFDPCVFAFNDWLILNIVGIGLIFSLLKHRV
jgi:hypothetical protein